MAPKAALVAVAAACSCVRSTVAVRDSLNLEATTRYHAAANNSLGKIDCSKPKCNSEGDWREPTRDAVTWYTKNGYHETWAFFDNCTMDEAEPSMVDKRNIAHNLPGLSGVPGEQVPRAGDLWVSEGPKHELCVEKCTVITPLWAVNTRQLGGIVMRDEKDVCQPSESFLTYKKEGHDIPPAVKALLDQPADSDAKYESGGE